MGISTAKKVGFEKIKINSVIKKPINDEGIIDLVDSLDLPSEFSLLEVINRIKQARIDRTIPEEDNREFDIYELRHLITLLKSRHPGVFKQFLNLL